jgi:hypothetical protein
MAVAAMAYGLLPAIDLAERERLVRDLGPHDAMIMYDRGLLTCGATIPQAFNTMYQLEMSCRAQLDAMAARTELTMPGENVLAHTAHLYQPGTRRPYGVLEWPAMLRRLAAEGKSSGYPPYCSRVAPSPSSGRAGVGPARCLWKQPHPAALRASTLPEAGEG